MERSRYYAYWSVALLLGWPALWLFVLPWPEHGWLILLGAYLVADVGSYLFHYVFDHFMDPARSRIAHEFQWHHLDPGGITRRPIAENLEPAAAMLVPPLLALAIAAVLTPIAPSLVLLCSTVGLIVVFAQVLHRWSHAERTHRLVATLQRARLIVTPSAHDRHHAPPHGSHYAIVSGWSNPILDALGMPRLLDALFARFGVPRRTGYELRDAPRRCPQ
jgi:hypothetical protein